MTEKWIKEQPLDLRVKSVAKRENKPYDRDIPKTEDKNCILASLLKQSSESKAHLTSSKYEKFCHNPRSQTEEPKTVYSRTQYEEPEKCISVLSNSLRKRTEKEKACFPLEDQDDEISIVFDKNSSDHSLDETDLTKFVPNYRKFYSRYYQNQQSIVTSSREKSYPRYVEPIRPIPRKNSTFHHKLSLSFRNQQLKWCLEEQNTPTARSFSEKSSTRKDEILKCLLTNSVNNNSYPNGNYFLHYTAADQKWLCSKNELFYRFKNSHRYFKSFPLPRNYHPDNVEVRDGILKSLLIPSQDRKPDQTPFDASSPGSESTTSAGSTDSGVYSDNISDDNKKVTRGLSGKYIKAGTGASITTLKLLRQVIIERRRRNDRHI